MKSIIILCSLFIGTLLATQAVAQRGQGATMNQEYMEWKMRKDLGLSDDQIAKIKEMREKHQAQAEADRSALREEMQKRREAMMKEREARRDEMRSKADNRQAELKSILTPEQYEKWQDIRFENYENQLQNRNLRQSNQPMRGSKNIRSATPNRPSNVRGYRNAPMQKLRRG